MLSVLFVWQHQTAFDPQPIGYGTGLLPFVFVQWMPKELVQPKTHEPVPLLFLVVSFGHTRKDLFPKLRNHFVEIQHHPQNMEKNHHHHCQVQESHMVPTSRHPIIPPFTSFVS